jgi:branched-chain amino acid transport system substrate-binding protein
MKKLASVALALTAAGALAACGSGSGSGSSDSGAITIGSIHPTSGDLAGVGSLMDDGAKMAVDDINKAGGIKALDGRKLKLSSGDSQGKAEVGQSEAQRMIDDGAVALVGTYQSDVTQNVASVAERGRVPLVIDVAVDDKILDQGYKYSFRVQPNATSMGTSGAESLAQIGKDAGDPITRVAYLHIEGAFGDSVFDAFKAKAANQGITDIKEITYPPTNFSDATTQVREAAAYKPDVIVATGYFPDGVLIAKAVNELKPDIKGLYGIANGAFDDGSFPSAAGPAAQGVLSANYHYDAKSSKVQDIRKRFEQKYGKPMETASVLSYQAVEVVAAGLEKAKDTDPEKVREGISGVKLDEPLLAFDGPITFDKTGQNENATVIVMQNLKNTVSQVYPEEFAQTKIQFPAGGAQ